MKHDPRRRNNNKAAKQNLYSSRRGVTAWLKLNKGHYLTIRIAVFLILKSSQPNAQMVVNNVAIISIIGTKTNDLDQSSVK